MEWRAERTSCAIPLITSQSNLGTILRMKTGFRSNSTCSSSASLGCRGKADCVCLQALRAQVRKFRVRSFIFLLSFLYICLSGRFVGLVGLVEVDGLIETGAWVGRAVFGSLVGGDWIYVRVQARMV